MRAGVLDGYRTCVSWFHYWDFIERFPAADPDLLIADRLFVIDRRRITCSGGRASIDVAAAILLRHFDHATVQKALRILLVGEMQKGNAPQPHPPGLEPATHPKVKRAILLMEQHVGRALSLDGFASKLDLSTRQLERLFKAETGKIPQAFAKQVRLRTAAWLLTAPTARWPISRRAADSPMRRTSGANSASSSACRLRRIGSVAGKWRKPARQSRRTPSRTSPTDGDGPRSFSTDRDTTLERICFSSIGTGSSQFNRRCTPLTKGYPGCCCTFKFV